MSSQFRKPFNFEEAASVDRFKNQTADEDMDPRIIDVTEPFVIRNQALYDEIEEYSREIQAAAKARRTLRMMNIALALGGFFLISMLFYSLVISPAVNTAKPVIDKHELTAHPLVLLNEAATLAGEKTVPGQMYIVKVTVEAL